MVSADRQKSIAKRKNRAAEIANTFEWLITAFVLAFLFRAFVMEAFRIPTGSMAETLKGAHFRMRCPQCGYRYNHGGGNYGIRDTVPRVYIGKITCRCPSCGWYQQARGRIPVAGGDRILVLKCIYQFVEPERWDVVVFKNPLEPSVNYIKRLVGLPAERIEIIDGDVYINGLISRKPPKVQEELWMPVYNNDYHPVRPQEIMLNGHAWHWQQPFNVGRSAWRIDEDNPARFRLDSVPDQINAITYGTSVGNDFRATYAYDSVKDFSYMPYCSDLMVRFFVSSTDSQGRIGASLGKYGIEYKAWVELSGEMIIQKCSNGADTELVRKQIVAPVLNKPHLLRFANVDHQLVLEFGREKLVWDLGRSPEDAGPRRTDVPPAAAIFGSGKLVLSHAAIFRDIHYTSTKFANSRETGRATEGNAFTLGPDQFFMLGDNSPNSEDSRWWDRKGIANNGLDYDAGIVPRDYLVGKALFVYWPSGFRPFGAFPLSFIPNVGLMRFIHGGSNN